MCLGMGETGRQYAQPDVIVIEEIEQTMALLHQASIMRRGLEEGQPLHHHAAHLGLRVQSAIVARKWDLKPGFWV